MRFSAELTNKFPWVAVGLRLRLREALRLIRTGFGLCAYLSACAELNTMITNTITISERHEDGSIQIHDNCDARKASIILETAWEIMCPPYEVIQDFVRKNDQGENLLGED